MKTERFTLGTVAEDADALSGTVVEYGDTSRDARRVRFAPGCFAPLGDVTLNVMHDDTRLLARTDGGGLTLTDTASALSLSAALPTTREAKDTLKLVRGAVLRGLSLECGVVSERRAPDGARFVTKARLTAVAVVDRPALPASTLAAREGATGGAGAWWWS